MKIFFKLLCGFPWKTIGYSMEDPTPKGDFGHMSSKSDENCTMSKNTARFKIYNILNVLGNKRSQIFKK